ncbi:MAG: hypothetical protein RIK87_21105 [Fuerstiella sp.]
MPNTVATSQPVRTATSRRLFPAKVRRDMPLLVAIAEQMPWVNGYPEERLAAARRLLAEVVASHDARPPGHAMPIATSLTPGSPDGR